MAWYDAHRRDLPWRGSGDPYAVWVSEVMLQQTRVETVLGYYARWMGRFPTVQALADADEEEVMALWAGLGYYGRARRLHEAAQIAAAGMPRDAAGLRRLPGVGEYTAGAVASIAYDEPVPAIDGNAVRVLSRWAGIREPADKAAGRRRIHQAAKRWLHPDRPGDWNQALMDLGSKVCRPAAPRCGDCPVAAGCDARRAGDAEALPVLAAKRAPREVTMHFARIRDGPRFLVVPRPPGGLLAGTWMLPGGPDDEALEDQVAQQTGLLVRLEPAGRADHTFTHRIWRMAIHDAQVIDGEPRGRWVDPAAADVAISTAARKAIGA